MKYLLFILSLFIFSCSDEEKKPVDYPYTFIDKKIEEENEMELYTIGEKYDTDSLVLFCKEQKEKFNNGAFHIIVFFNKKENARFPNNPITAMYIENEDIKNIVADYTYNHINGYSKLTFYKNGKTVEIK